MSEPQFLSDFLAWHAPPLVPLISNGIMYEGSKVILYGKYKTMKSMLAMRFGLAVASGEDWLGFQTAGGKRVLYLQLEIPPPLLQKRFIAMNAQPTEQFIVWTETNIALDTTEGMATVEEVLEDFEPDILILDPIYKVMSGNLIENSQVKIFIDRIDDLMNRYNPLSVMLVSHTRKGKYEAGFGDSDDLIGGFMFSAWADSVIKVERTDHSRLKISFEVIRHADEEILARVFEVTDEIDFKWQIGQF